MKKHPILRLFKSCLKFIGFMAVSNIVFKYAEDISNTFSGRKGETYSWKYGDIFYNVKGNGSPVLLIHDLTPSSKGDDLSPVANYLATCHTVYTIDLLGFGMSEKPWITYTNFFYITLIRDFIRDVIGSKTVIYSSKGSCLIALQANNYLKEDVAGVYMIDPCYTEKIAFPKDSALNLKKLLEIPVLGTFCYNVYALICAFPANKSSLYFFTSLLCGFIETDISKHHNLITSNVKIIESKPVKRKLLDELYYADTWVGDESLEGLNPVK